MVVPLSTVLPVELPLYRGHHLGSRLSPERYFEVNASNVSAKGASGGPNVCTESVTRPLGPSGSTQTQMWIE